jgi:hypothetical protein
VETVGGDATNEHQQGRGDGLYQDDRPQRRGTARKVEDKHREGDQLELIADHAHGGSEPVAPVAEQGQRREDRRPSLPGASGYAHPVSFTNGWTPISLADAF